MQPIKAWGTAMIDMAGVRYLVEHSLRSYCGLLFKNFGLYRERVGVLLT